MRTQLSKDQERVRGGILVSGRIAFQADATADAKPLRLAQSEQRGELQN